jgi:2-C-methyl-D-erythritol 4-phosphate cytidylyltransferase
MPRFLALIPAAGSGSRMAGSLPKQYLEISGRPLLAYAIERLAAHSLIEQVFVVLAPQDVHFAKRDWRVFSEKMTPLYCGGATRAQSVFNGLIAASDAMEAADWVLVHDAARPCLGRAELDRLLEELREDATGGLLAVPVADTLKRADADAAVIRTEARNSLWLAQTPQMFRYRLLVDALRLARDVDATDEACAIERLGLKPRLVPGNARNIKVTHPGDLELAELILKSEARGA